MDEETRRAFLVRYAALAMTAAAATIVPQATATAAENGLPAQPPSPPFAPPEPPRVVALYGPQSPGRLPPLDGSGRFRVLYGPPSVGDRPGGPVSPPPSGMGQPMPPK